MAECFNCYKFNWKKLFHFDQVGQFCVNPSQLSKQQKENPDNKKDPVDGNEFVKL